jgi:hypothetical protein
MNVPTLAELAKLAEEELEAFRLLEKLRKEKYEAWLRGE